MNELKRIIGPLLLGVLAFGSAPAAAFSQEDALRHRQALGLFEDACLRLAPEFTGAEAVFGSLGLQRPAEASAYRNPELEIYGGVVPMQAGDIFGRQCTVMLGRGNLAVLVLGLRTALDRMAEPGTLAETPPSREEDPVLWDFRLPRIGAVSVTAGLGQQGIAVMGMQVAERDSSNGAGE
ncbi:MAG: hypothetical protein AAF415_04770 [Pseudomonadota bacterium]